MNACQDLATLVRSRDESIGAPLDPFLFWLDNILKWQKIFLSCGIFQLAWWSCWWTCLTRPSVPPPLHWTVRPTWRVSSPWISSRAALSQRIVLQVRECQHYSRFRKGALCDSSTSWGRRVLQVKYGVYIYLDSMWTAVYVCTHWLRPLDPPPPRLPYLGSCMRVILVSQDRKHLFVTPCWVRIAPR